MRRSVLVLAAVTACSPASGSSSAPVTRAPDASDVGAPRPIAPASLSFSTSRLPVFRWELAPGSDGARVEVCADRGCARMLASFDAHGDSAVPAAELPAGVVFWRLRGLSAGDAGSATSVAWELVIPPRSAPVATTWGAMLDANGDGLGDVVVGDSFELKPSQHAYVYLGGAHGPAAAPSAVLSGRSAVEHYAASLTGAGDLDGDGYADLAIGSPNEDTVYVYRGAPGGYADPPSVVLTGPAESRFGASVSAAGDVNADGYSDLVIGLPGAQQPPGSSVVGGARVYLGGASGLSPSRFVDLRPPASSDEQGFGAYVSGAGDWDADGRSDVAVYGGTGSFDPQRIYVYLGRSAPFGAAPDSTLLFEGTDYSWLDTANILSCVGDVNGDGYADLAVTTPPLGAAYTIDHVSVFLGGPASTPVPWRQLDSPVAAMTDHFGMSVAGGDFDRDGLDDLAVGTLCFETVPPSALVYAGSAGDPWLQTRITTLDRAWQPSREVGTPGDVDGDGYPDLLVGYPGRETTMDAADGGTGVLHGAVEVHRGGPRGVSPSAAWTLLPPDSTTVAFGGTLPRP